MIKKFNEHKTESILNSIYSDLCKKDLLPGLSTKSSSSSDCNVLTISGQIDGTLIICDRIQNKVNKRLWDSTYYININFKRVECDIKKEIFIELEKLESKYNEFIRVIISYLTSGKMQTIEFTDEVLERVEEFEVIKNGRIDWISLNNLFDFYNIEFDEISFKKKIGYNEIH